MTTFGVFFSPWVCEEESFFLYSLFFDVFWWWSSRASTSVVGRQLTLDKHFFRVLFVTVENITWDTLVQPCSPWLGMISFTGNTFERLNPNIDWLHSQSRKDLAYSYLGFRHEITLGFGFMSSFKSRIAVTAATSRSLYAQIKSSGKQFDHHEIPFSNDQRILIFLDMSQSFFAIFSWFCHLFYPAFLCCFSILQWKRGSRHESQQLAIPVLLPSLQDALWIDIWSHDSPVVLLFVSWIRTSDCLDRRTSFPLHGSRHSRFSWNKSWLHSLNSLVSCHASISSSCSPCRTRSHTCTDRITTDTHSLSFRITILSSF